MLPHDAQVIAIGDKQFCASFVACGLEYNLHDSSGTRPPAPVGASAIDASQHGSRLRIERVFNCTGLQQEKKGPRESPVAASASRASLYLPKRFLAETI